MKKEAKDEKPAPPPDTTPWENLGLDGEILEKITEAKYHVPTPIQQKTIPTILQGRDVIAMARTGSGKTAAFLLPMIQKLSKTERKVAPAKPGDSIRALIVSPTRELALQTLKFCEQFAPNLKCCSIIGGESMGDQFSQLTSNKMDVIVCVPGRFMHILTEMSCNRLINVEYLVFDEADRLFEQNFQIQLNEILTRCKNENKQTLLFSATMPPKIAEFASAGLHDPSIIRLDVEHKLPEQIKLEFLYCRPDSKYAMLLYLLRNAIEVDDADTQTIVFCATKYHVEFIQKLLEKLFIKSSYLFSSMNQHQRTNNMDKFREKKTNVLVCTDVAARGVDIPELDNVIHFHFPANGKTFIHRCGRVCRAGRSDGKAISIVSGEEIPYVVNVVKYVNHGKSLAENTYRLTQDEINIHMESIKKILEQNSDVSYLDRLARKSEKQYYKTRPSAPVEVLKDAKILLNRFDGGGLPIYHEMEIDETDQKRVDMIDQIKHYRGRTTVFETGVTKSSLGQSKMMENMRTKQKKTLEKLKSQGYDPRDQGKQTPEFMLNQMNNDVMSNAASKDFDSAGLLIDPNADDEMTKMLKKRAGIKEQIKKRWDGKKYVRIDAGNTKYMKTWSGQKVKASFKSDKYEKWKQMNKADAMVDGANMMMEDKMKPAMQAGVKRKFNKDNQLIVVKSEIKNREQVTKYNVVQAKKHEKMMYDKKKHESRVKAQKKNKRK